jgi:protein-disulfide isomerase
MTGRTVSYVVLAAALATLTLNLQGCSSEKPAGEVVSGAPIAKIAPPAGKAWTDIATKTADGGYLMGNPNAPIKLIEYGSLSCGACAKLAQDGFEKLTTDYVASGRVSFEFRSFAIHPQDVPLTLLAACGGDPASFIPRAEQLYVNFDAVAETSQKGTEQAQAAMQLGPDKRFPAMADAMGFTDFFAARGVAKDQAHACLAKIDDATAFAKQSEKYGKDGINQTPTLMINGSKVNLGSSPWAELESALQRAGAR